LCNILNEFIFNRFAVASVGCTISGFHPELFIFNRFAVGNTRFIPGLKCPKRAEAPLDMNGNVAIFGGKTT